MRYLIAGGAGFIGSNLVRRLIRQSIGNEITVVDDFSTGSRDNLKNLGSYVCTTEMDICKLELWDFASWGNEQPFDRIINLACPASPVAYQNQPLHTLHTSIIGTERLLKLAQRDGARYLHTSTSEVYGDPTEHPQTEEYWGNVNCYGPRACYDEGKRAAETLIYEYQKQQPNPVDARIIRIFNTYGPYMAADDGRVVSNFICQALSGEPITIYGQGLQTRSFCYVDDLIDGMLQVLEGDRWDKPINVGNPTEFSINELAQVVLNVVHGDQNTDNAQVIFDSLPVDDPKQRRPDISKMREYYSWEPKVPLRQGIEKTVQYFRGRLLQLPKVDSKVEV